MADNEEVAMRQSSGRLWITMLAKENEKLREEGDQGRI